MQYFVPLEELGGSTCRGKWSLEKIVGEDDNNIYKVKGLNATSSQNELPSQASS